MPWIDGRAVLGDDHDLVVSEMAKTVTQEGERSSPVLLEECFLIPICTVFKRFLRLFGMVGKTFFFFTSIHFFYVIPAFKSALSQGFLHLR
jgi:hypothetical protein